MTDTYLWVPSEDLATAQLPGLDILAQECVTWSWHMRIKLAWDMLWGLLAPMEWVPLWPVSGENWCTFLSFLGKQFVSITVIMGVGR